MLSSVTHFSAFLIHKGKIGRLWYMSVRLYWKCRRARPENVHFRILRFFVHLVQGVKQGANEVIICVQSEKFGQNLASPKNDDKY